jgi:SAM-dependent methyltransferase
LSQTPYSYPFIYDIAFRWRDFEGAVDFLAKAAALSGLEQIDSMIELGCGPGQYCREFGNRGARAIGLDLQPEMITYGNQLETQSPTGCVFLEGDMRMFELEEPVDLAVCMMATISLMLTNEDMIRHLRSVHRAVRPGGLYIVEMGHPRDVFRAGESQQTGWEMEAEGLSVKVEWNTDSSFDPLTQVATGVTRYTVTGPNLSEVLESPVQERSIGWGHFQALVTAAGGWEIVAAYGTLDTAQPFDNSKDSWRMIPVLRRS